MQIIFLQIALSHQCVIIATNVSDEMIRQQ